MKDKSTIQDPPPEPEEGKFKAAAKRRENYSLTRDLKARIITKQSPEDWLRPKKTRWKTSLSSQANYYH